MRGSALSAFGWAARTARKLGLGGVLATLRDSADRVYLRFDRPPLVAHVGTIELRGFLRHRSFLAHLERGYEEYLTEVFTTAVRPGATVIDGGAHVGLHTILGSRLTGAGGRVLAFEPDPYNYAALRGNVRRNACDNVTLSRKALADAPGRSVLHQSLGTVSTSLVKRDARYGQFRSVDVDLTTLDHELAASDFGPIVVKLDLEGAEPRALAGMTSLAGRTDLVCMVEVNPEALAAAGASLSLLTERLSGLGLECRWIDEEARSLTKVESPSRQRKGNLFCAPTAENADYDPRP